MSPGTAATPQHHCNLPGTLTPLGYLDVAADAADAGVGLQDAEHLGSAGGVQHRV